MPGLKCQLSEDCASSVINDLNCYEGVVLNPVSLYPLHVVWCGVMCGVRYGGGVMHGGVVLVRCGVMRGGVMVVVRCGVV